MAISLPLPRRQRRDPEAELDFRQHPELNAAKARLADIEQGMPAAIQLAQDTAAAHTSAVAELQQLEDMRLIDRATDDQVVQARQAAENARREAVRARVNMQDLSTAFDDARAQHARLDATAKADAINGLQAVHRVAVGKLVDALLEARAQGLEIRRLVELADSQFPEGHSGNNSGINNVTVMRNVAWPELDGQEDPYNPTRLGTWLQELADAGMVQTKTIAPVLSADQRQIQAASRGYSIGDLSTASSPAPAQQPAADPMMAELVADETN